MQNFWKIICKFQTANHLVYWKPYLAPGYVDTAYDKTVGWLQWDSDKAHKEFEGQSNQMLHSINHSNVPQKDNG